MSGHSKWHNIKRRKEVVDAKKGAAFTKFSAEIASAVRSGGPDPNANALLRDTIARARKAGFPQTNIDRLLSKDGSNAKPITYEAFGPVGVGIIISARTDNTNRTVGQLRTILNNHGGSLGTPNSVMWKFTHDQSAGIYTPKFSQPLDPSLKPQLDKLLQALESHPDVEHIFTDAS